VVWVNSPLASSSAQEARPAGESAAPTEHALVKAQGTLKRYSRADMRDMLRAADAFVLPTRGEGWGLPIAEAMATALPVIVSNCSGILAYARDDNALLIPVADEPDELGFARPDALALSALMRSVVAAGGSGPGSDAAVVVDAAELGSQTAVMPGSAEARGALREKGRVARRTMQEISPQSVVSTVEERLRYLASLRGWKL
jgi:hypothetical protein